VTHILQGRLNAVERPMLRLTQTWGRGVISFHKFIHALLISNPEARRVTTSGDSRMKKLGGGTAGPRKVGGQHKCLSCMAIFRCKED